MRKCTFAEILVLLLGATFIVSMIPVLAEPTHSNSSPTNSGLFTLSPAPDENPLVQHYDTAMMVARNNLEEENRTISINAINGRLSISGKFTNNSPVYDTQGSAELEWQKCLGGNDWDEAFSIQQTTDHGYIVAGRTKSNNGNVIGNHGDFDYWVVKLGPNGALEWQKCFGGSNEDIAYCIQQTMDGCCVD